MRYQDQAVRMTKFAMQELFKTARAVPADKLEWEPLDNGRSVLDQLQECAQSPLWFAEMLKPDWQPESAQEEAEAAAAQRRSWTTIDQCEQAAKRNCEALYEAIGRIPEDDLEREVPTPWGMTPNVAEVALFQYWNATYHYGQTNYIQTLYGDHEMH